MKRVRNQSTSRGQLCKAFGRQIIVRCFPFDFRLGSRRFGWRPHRLGGKKRSGRLESFHPRRPVRSIRFIRIDFTLEHSFELEKGLVDFSRAHRFPRRKCPRFKPPSPQLSLPLLQLFQIVHAQENDRPRRVGVSRQPGNRSREELNIISETDINCLCRRIGSGSNRSPGASHCTDTRRVPKFRDRRIGGAFRSRRNVLFNLLRTAPRGIRGSSPRWYISITGARFVGRLRLDKLFLGRFPIRIIKRCVDAARSRNLCSGPFPPVRPRNGHRNLQCIERIQRSGIILRWSLAGDRDRRDEPRSHARARAVSACARRIKSNVTGIFVQDRQIRRRQRHALGLSTR